MNIEYRQHVCDVLRAESQSIADKWLRLLEPIVQEELRDIFPTDQYLDHIPAMIEQIGILLATSEESASLSNSTLSRKALQLGTLRHQQKATISQLLREYDILANVLEQVISDCSQTYQGSLTTADAISLTGAVNNTVRYILQCTVDSFTEKYMVTIQEQTDKLVSFNRFVGHELRTPLQNALLHTELLIESRDITDPDTADLIRVKGAIQAASSLIVNIEEIMRDTDGIDIDSPSVQTLQINGLVRDIDEQLSPALQEREIDLRCDGELGVLNVETGKLRLILTNLISNSIKYCDVNKQESVIEVRRSETADGEVAVSVWDNGLGIPADMLHEVQGLRIRAHRDLDDANKVSGDGLGLYLVAEAVRDIGGVVKIESEEGKFTCVTISIPSDKQRPFV